MNTVIWCLIDEATDMEARAAAENLRYAWLRWAEETCIEWNGDHLWEMELLHPDNDAYVEIACTYCGCGLDMYGSDLIELVDTDIAGVRIEDGKHNSPTPMVIPIDLRIEWTEHSSPACGTEYDVEITITQRGPARTEQQA